KVIDGSVDVEGSLACSLISGAQRKTLLLVPATARSCQFSFRYCGSKLSFSHKPIRSGLEWLAERLPLSIRSNLPRQFWQWVGFGPRDVPSEEWRRVSVEVPLPQL